MGLTLSRLLEIRFENRKPLDLAERIQLTIEARRLEEENEMLKKALKFWNPRHSLLKAGGRK